MNIIESIKNSISNDDNELVIARKVYLHHLTEIFKDDQDTEFYIKDEISSKFKIPFSSISIVGSTKTGFSFFKESKFKPGESDLDIAVISLPLFMNFMQEAHGSTDGFIDETPFPIFKGQNVKNQFVRNLKHGYINPFFMPKCDLRSEWLEFFLKLGNKHFELFKSINGGIYSSEYFFENKQKENIRLYKENPERYDKVSS